MNLEKLRRLQGRERRNDDLCDMDDDFFQEASAYLSELESVAQDDTRKMDELRNARRSLQGIFDRRVNKILNLVAASQEVDTDLGPMCPEERQLFSGLRDALDRHRERLQRIIDSPENNNSDSDDETDESGLKVVRVLEAVDDFVGTDGRSYRLEEDDVVALPAQSAEVLIETGSAEEIG